MMFDNEGNTAREVREKEGKIKISYKKKTNYSFICHFSIIATYYFYYH